MEVRFVAAGSARTRVELEHRHLERHGDGWEQMRDAVGSPEGWNAGLRVRDDTPDRVQFTGGSGSFSLVKGTPTEHLHLAFPTDDDAVVQRFHQAATDAGYPSNGPPGERPRYHPGYYAAYVLDPDGNNVEVVNHHRR